MCPVSKMEVEKESTLQKFNRLLNCADIGKDAYFTPSNMPRILTAQNEDFLKERVLTPLFNFKKLDRGSQLFVGIYNINFDKLYARIEPAFSLNEVVKEQLLIIRFDGNGNDLRRNHMNIAYDSGAKGDKFFMNHTLITTPGSILDSGLKSKNHKPVYNDNNAIKKASSLSKDLLKDLDLLNAVTDIKFRKPLETIYGIKIDTPIEGYKDKTYTFNKQTFTALDNVFKGNYSKNTFIRDNLNNPEKLDEIKMYVLAKALGDTIQVAWLKQIMIESIDGPLQLNKDDTALITIDKILWMRCLINDISCIHPHAGVPTLFLVEENKEKKDMRVARFKKTRMEALKAKNISVINEVKKFCHVILKDEVEIIMTGSEEIEPTSSQKKELKYIGETLVERLELKLKMDMKGAEEHEVSPTGDDMKRYTHWIEKQMMDSPFIKIGLVSETKNRIVFKGHSYQGINPKWKDNRLKIPINLEYLYRKIKTRSDITEEDYPKIFGDDAWIGMYRIIKRDDEEKPFFEMSGGSNVDIEELTAVFSANKDVPGFIPFFCLTNLYELMYIGYAYALALGIPAARFKTFFEGKTMEKIRAPFGKLGFNRVYEVDGNSHYYDPQFMELLQIIKMAYTARNDFCIFNVVTPDIEWFMTEIKGLLHAPVTKEAHFLALEYYQALYEVEFSLIFLNERHTKNPTNEIVHVRARSLTPPRVVVDKVPVTPTRYNLRSSPGSIPASNTRGRSKIKGPMVRSRSRSRSRNNRRFGPNHRTMRNNRV